MNSIDSISSLFDRYSQEGISSAHTTLDIKKPPIFEINECNEKIYSQFEPVNHILNTLFNSRYTLNKLGNGSNDIALSFLEYWKFEDEQYQILHMLEPELLKTQTLLFQIYHNIKDLKFEIDNEMQESIPKYLAQLDTNKRGQVYNALNLLLNIFSSLLSDLKYILQSNIITNIHSFSSRVLSDFTILENSSEFIVGISYFCNDPPEHLTALALKLSLLESIIPKTSSHIELDLVKQCTQRIAENIERERTRYNFFQTLSQIPQLLILVPFVMICWMIFSIKRFVNKPC